MNKNLQSLPSSFQEIVYPDFDTRLEVYDWIIYQQKELLLLFQCYLTHGVRTRKDIKIEKQPPLIVIRNTTSSVLSFIVIRD
jgi:hypothetical protein